MEYRYKKHQIFKKKLDVPKGILYKVYNETLTIKEYIDYDLVDKIPLSCIKESERKWVEKFGIDKFRNFDWELLNLYIYEEGIKEVPNILDELPSETEDLSLAIYEYYKDKIETYKYTTRMKELYKDRFFTEEEIKEQEENYYRKRFMEKFNRADLTVSEIIRGYWLLKNKDVSYCLLRDKTNTSNLTQVQIEEIVNNHTEMLELLSPHFDFDEVIDYVLNKTPEFEQKIIDYFRPILFDENKMKAFQERNRLTNQQYKALFQFFSLEEFLSAHYYSFPPRELLEELKTLPEGYIFDTEIPFVSFCESGAIRFVNDFGIKNTFDFDKECNGFFSKNDGYMLRNIFNMYLHYGNDSFRVKSYEDSDRGYTKEEFYQSLRNMITYGPTDYHYRDKAPNYREMTGEFRVKNKDIFLDDNAPQELQEKFYTKKVQIMDLIEHPEYIEFLRGRDLSSCFENRQIQVVEPGERYGGYVNIYSFMLKHFGFDQTIKTLIDYHEQIEHYYDYYNNPHQGSYSMDYKFPISDNIEDFHKVLNEFTKNMIIKEGHKYPDYLTESFKQQYPNLILKSDAPQELQEAFYTRTLTPDKLKQIPNYRQYLTGLDPNTIFKYISVKLERYKGQSNDSYYSNTEWTTFSGFIVQNYGYDALFDIIEGYGNVVDKISENKTFKNITFYKNMPLEELYEMLNVELYREITAGNIKYDNSVPKQFKDAHPTLFLDENVPEDIKHKFYNREFTLEDFQKDPTLLDYFTNTNIACGLDLQYSWLINTFENQDVKESNINRLKILEAYIKINDYQLQETFKKFVISNYDKLDYTNLEYVAEVLYKLSYSNSAEIYNFRNELATQILATEDPIDSLERIEEIFLKNNLPTVGKIFSTYDILHPNFAGFESANLTKMSPTLKHKSTKGKQITLFSDLLKAAFGSNNLSIKEYLENIEKGYALYQAVQNNEITYEELSAADKQELITFRNHLITLYNNTLKGKRNNKDIIESEDIISDITNLRKLFSPNGSMNYNLADRVISMYCHFAGFDTLEAAKKYFEETVRYADMRNRASSKTNLVLEEGDFLKGIGDIKYLRRILQNGSVSKEFLGASASSDSTPLDTDLSMITKVGATTEETINSTAASSYGNIIFVLKGDERFVNTRTKGGAETPQADKLQKLEVFYTGVCDTATSDHYGIRTGFASTTIDYIITDDKRVFIEIVLNGFYIPVVNKKGEIIFTPNDYDMLRAKMSGLSHYGCDDYEVSEHLVAPGVAEIEQHIHSSNEEIKMKREKINERVSSILKELNLTLKTQIDGDISSGSVELIDTGSTGRGTNKPYEGDFDFMMRLDKSILNNSQELNKIKSALLKGFGQTDNSGVIGTGDFRLKGVEIDGVTVDIDITFTEKTDKISYSTDMALQDRLETIQKLHPDKYSYVIANILLAKQVLKEAGVYKPNRGEIPQGGLGGVGVENWILQHGGSFIDASLTFLRAAKGHSFEEFKKIYEVWDFGENHLAERRGQYTHDNFITNNMSEEGYYKMQKALLAYIKQMNYTDEFDDDFDSDGGISI